MGEKRVFSAGDLQKVMAVLDGDGWVFVQMGGTVTERTLGPGDVLHVDTGCLSAYTPSIEFDLEMVRGVKSKCGVRLGQPALERSPWKTT